MIMLNLKHPYFLLIVFASVLVLVSLLGCTPVTPTSTPIPTYTKVEGIVGSIRLGPVGNCGASADWPRSEHSDKLDLQDGDRLTISVTADKAVVIAINVPNGGRKDLSGTGDTVFDHTYEAESSGVYRILINSTWPENQMAGCAGQDAGVQYEYTVKRPGYEPPPTAKPAAGKPEAVTQLPETNLELPVVTTGLVGHWKFDNPSSTIAPDFSGFGHTGSVMGAPNGVTGKFDGALRFDGIGDYVTIPDSGHLRLGSTQTVSAWYKWSESGVNWRRLVGKGDYSNRNYGLWIRPESNMILFQIYDGNGKGCQALDRTVSFDTDWHHLAGSYDGATFRLYYDSQLVQETHCSITPSNTNHPVTIGFANGPWGDYDNSPFDGLIDDVRIYNRTLSDCEIAALDADTC